METSDTELVARVLATDDRHAFAVLVHRHQGAVRAFLLRLAGGRHAWADDLAQETFIQCHRSLSRFHGGSQFRTWLLGIAYNRFRSAGRREHHRSTALGEISEPGHELADPAPVHTAKCDLQHDLAAAVATLSPEQQTVLHLCFHEGLSHSEASCVLEWPLGSVKTHLLRAREKLRHHLRAWAPN